VETPHGPAWRRYNGDGYGEHDDGSPFDGTGVGRAWPLLTGERGHYELAAGNSPLPYLQTMSAMSSPSGMIPEQVWDKEPLAKRGLYPGMPTGSAMPLAWAHAEFIKLAYSWVLKRPFDRPSSVWERYHGQRPNLVFDIWSPGAPVSTLGVGKVLHICLARPGNVYWRMLDKGMPQQTATSPAGLGLHFADIDIRHLEPNQNLHFNIKYRGRPREQTENSITMKAQMDV
jgi:glucoamylase